MYFVKQYKLNSLFKIGFINFICAPLYTTLERLIPESKPLLTGVLSIKEHWQMVLAERAQQKATLTV